MEKYSPLATNSPTEEIFPEEVDSLDIEYRGRYIATRGLRNKFAIAITHISLFMANIIFTSGLIYYMSPSRAARNGDLPDILEYDHHSIDVSSIYFADGSWNTKKIFAGPPSEKLDSAWRNLTRYMNIRLLPNEMGQFKDDNEIIELSDGSGSYGTLAVYHAVHCTHRLYQYLNKEHYHADITETEQKRLLRQHTEHCIDYLRQYVQCNADTTIIPMYWTQSQPLPGSVDRGQHQCANWAALQGWMEVRSFDPFEPGLLMHPKFGSPYENPRHKNVGIVVDPILQD